MIQITKQNVSETKLLIKLVADSNKELLQNFWTYINYNRDCVKIRQGVELEKDTGLNYLTDWGENKSGYFRTTEKDFLKTLENIELIRILDKRKLYCPDNQIPQKLIKQSQNNARQIYNDIPDENVLNQVDYDEESL